MCPLKLIYPPCRLFSTFLGVTRFSAHPRLNEVYLVMVTISIIFDLLVKLHDFPQRAAVLSVTKSQVPTEL